MTSWRLELGMASKFVQHWKNKWMFSLVISGQSFHSVFTCERRCLHVRGHVSFGNMQAGYSHTNSDCTFDGQVSFKTWVDPVAVRGFVRPPVSPIFQTKFHSLRKQAYSNIRKFKYQKKKKKKKKKKIQIKIWYFSYFCSKQRLWYSLEPPHRVPQSMFLSRNKKINVYPCKPQFYYIKVGFKGINIKAPFRQRPQRPHCVLKT